MLWRTQVIMGRTVTGMRTCRLSRVLPVGITLQQPPQQPLLQPPCASHLNKLWTLLQQPPLDNPYTTNLIYTAGNSVFFFFKWISWIQLILIAELMGQITIEQPGGALECSGRRNGSGGCCLRHCDAARSRRCCRRRSLSLCRSTPSLCRQVNILIQNFNWIDSS